MVWKSQNTIHKVWIKAVDDEECFPTDTDNDGTPDYLDLDSDGDGCSDSFEAGAIAAENTDNQFTGEVGANGLVDNLETSVDSGEINYKNIFKYIYNKGFKGILGMEHGNSLEGKEGELKVIKAYQMADDFV